MKQKLSLIFLLLIAVVQLVGQAADFPQEGIVVWSLTIIFLGLGAYFSKYLPDKKKK
ncbi:hypothetical protein [Thalassobacillus hwangdonensis]|uniref:Uncharacterized protein n=1 Tax=Thalassobacillus hwangdonensis TaxID=546108 RepID=A0ABW3L2B1_9BACI